MSGLLDAQDRASIEALIAEIERTTAGELVVVVAERCDAYAAWRAPWVLGGAIVCAELLYWGAPWIPVPWLFVAELPLAALFWWLTGIAPIVRAVVPAPVLGDSVAQRCHQLFVERGVTETRDRSGVLLLLAELEHRVEILADRGIHARVGVEGWTRHTQQIVEAIRGGRAADGLAQALREIGRALAEAFPPRDDDENELPNRVERVE